jgi:short-subunit dehydrogenase
VIDPDDVARAVLHAVDHDRREVFVPRVFRIASIAQALLPNVVGRMSARSAYRPRIQS